MTIKFHYILFIGLCATTILSCKKDNYKAPAVTLNGKLTYKGEALQFQYNQIEYQLYQYGFGNVGAIYQNFAQDGSFSSLLFAGNYKLTIPNGQVPFKWNQGVPGVPDSLSIALTANQTMNIEVVPYYMIRTPQFSVASGAVKTSFKAEQIVTDATAKPIERVALILNKTQFVSGDGNEHVQEIDLLGSAITDPNNISISAAVPTLIPSQNYIFARIGLKVAGLEKWIFSPVQKLTF